MGIIQSIFCSISFCIERILTWVCCAVVLISLLFTIVLLMIYGITVGYHYAQKELVAFAFNARATTEAARRAASPPNEEGLSFTPNHGETEGYYYQNVRNSALRNQLLKKSTSAALEVYRTKKPIGGAAEIFWDTADSPDTFSILDEFESLETEHTTDMSQHEKELARRLLGRVRRSQITIL